MIGSVFLTLTGFGLAAFMVNRLYVLFTRKQINVHGITYSREHTPIMYWLEALMIVFGLLAGSVLGVAGATGLIFG